MVVARQVSMYYIGWMATKKKPVPPAKTGLVPINFRIDSWMVEALDEVVAADAEETRGRFVRSDLIREILGEYLASRGYRAPGTK